MEFQNTVQRTTLTSIPPEAQVDEALASNLVEYARKHRYRLRNLHDGGPVPPARYRKLKGKAPVGQAGYIGQDDRHDAIVGYDGCIADEGEPGQLGICLFYKSGRGVKRAHARIQAMGGTIKQVGDAELAGSVPVDRIQEALKLVKVSKLSPGNPNARPPSRSS